MAVVSIEFSLLSKRQIFWRNGFEIDVFVRWQGYDYATYLLSNDANYGYAKNRFFVVDPKDF